MPFTVAHTITAVPLRRLFGKRAVPSALVIGAMVPDFRHLVPGLDSLGTHTLAALVWFSLPVGLATYALFQTALRAPALAVLPLSVRQRLGRFIRPTSARVAPPLAAVALCVLVGAVSHLAWDELTHRGTVVEHFSGFFYTVLWHRRRHYLYIYTLIQYGSSVLGFVLLVAWCRRWLAAQPLDETIGPGASPLARAVAVVLLFVAPTTASIVRFFFVVRARVPLRDAPAVAVWQAGRAFAVGVLVGAVDVLVFALVWRLRHRRVAL